MNSPYTIWTIVVVLLCSSTALAHPTLIPHAHSTNSIQWELDSTKDGTTAHNHLWNRSFGANQLTREPYSADSCWDNGTWRLDNDPVNFKAGHCYVDDGLYQNDPVTYRFVGSVPSNAKAAIRQAFEEWSNLNTPFTTITPHGQNGYRVNLVFVEVSSLADIDVYWENQNGVNNGGFFNEATTDLHFDLSMDWDYSLSPAGVDDSKWHLLTVALHEVGHSVGLEHQLDWGDDVMAPPVGGPGSAGSRSVWYYVDDDSAHGVYELYGISQPPPPPPPTLDRCDVQLVTCNGSTAMFAITPYINESYPITNIHMDTKKGAQLWSPQYDGPFTCPTHGDYSSFWYRIFIYTAYGSTMCTDQVYVNPVDPCQQDPW